MFSHLFIRYPQKSRHRGHHQLKRWGFRVQLKSSPNSDTISSSDRISDVLGPIAPTKSRVAAHPLQCPLHNLHLFVQMQQEWGKWIQFENVPNVEGLSDKIGQGHLEAHCSRNYPIQGPTGPPDLFHAAGQYIRRQLPSAVSLRARSR